MHTDRDACNVAEQRLNRLREQVRSHGSFDYARLHVSPLPKSGSSMAYFDLGDPDGTPMLCLHGLSVSGFYFEQFQAYFVANGIRAIAPCLLGGVYIPDARKTAHDLARDLIELLDLLAIDRFDVIGFSWGTLPELALLARVPRRIGRAGFLGPMLPLKFLDPRDVGRLKSDVRLSIGMAGRVPALHRGLMWLVCRLPVSALLNQFKDDNLSINEANALAPGSAFGANLSRCILECTGTGSRFFTDGWRMFLDEPGYALGDLASAASHVEVRFYVGEHDNVHLPSNATLLAAACTGAAPGELEPVGLRLQRQGAGHGIGAFVQVYSRGPCSIHMAPGAGRMACILYVEDALDDMLSSSGHDGSERGR
jgi:pimeloyl-ACP methyl ester carboxylesterase